ncbi:MAG: ATP-binding protein [Campylobacterota bacterium]|nr:ATP-binding protein [Campylobacterota bacterium]
MDKKFKYTVIFVVLLFSISIFVISNFILDKKVIEIKNSIYNKTVTDVHKNIDLLIKNKKDSTLSIALTLSVDNSIIESLINNNHKNIDLKKLSKQLKDKTRFKNVWFQIIDKKGFAFYRSWTDKRADAIYKARMDIVDMLKNQTIKSTISVGRFDMTFKIMVPIFKNEQFLGIIEVITHFNSIAKKLSSNGIEPLIVADKKYKNQLTQPLTKLFIGDYYIANFNADKTLLQLSSEELEKYITMETNFIIDTMRNYFVMLYRIPDIHGDDMGYMVLVKKFDSFNMNDVNNTKDNILSFMILSIILIFVIGYYIFSNKYNSILNTMLHNTKMEKDKIDAILSSQPYIIILTYNNKAEEVNKKFFEFFAKYKTLKEFKKENDCVCDFFVKPKDGDKSYLYDKKDWITEVLKQPNHEMKVAMMKGKEEKYFVLKATKANIKDLKDDFIVLTFVDITEIKAKNKQLMEQSKHASMGEMIGNIAHQWRQPLSVISTGVTGMMLQKEYGLLEDDIFIKTCNTINDNAQYLSKTIDDFKNFIKGDTNKEIFNLKDNIDKFLHLIEPVIRGHNIDMVVNIDDDLILNSYSNELLQCFMNIFNNSKDALCSKEIENKIVFIDAYKNKNFIDVRFKDNAGGIPEDIINKIFEPYFTTKHESLGTGLGLHMTYNLINNHLDGRIEVFNEEFKYNNKDYKGASFIIKVPFVKI